MCTVLCCTQIAGANARAHAFGRLLCLLLLLLPLNTQKDEFDDGAKLLTAQQEISVIEFAAHHSRLARHTPSNTSNTTNGHSVYPMLQNTVSNRKRQRNHNKRITIDGNDSVGIRPSPEIISHQIKTFRCGSILLLLLLLSNSLWSRLGMEFVDPVSWGRDSWIKSAIRRCAYFKLNCQFS